MGLNIIPKRLLLWILVGAPDLALFGCKGLILSSGPVREMRKKVPQGAEISRGRMRTGQGKEAW